MNRSDQIIHWRRELHQIPEKGLEEHFTRQAVCAILNDYKIEYDLSLSDTGIVACIDGGQPGPSLAFRADMDGLPINEMTEKEYQSTHLGYMHACGHDGHMAILLGFLTQIKMIYSVFPGRIIGIFQPGEEGFFGAKAMLEAGLFKKYPVDAVYGLHLWNFIESGHLSVPDGAIMAAADEFYVTITGKGGHAAQPQATADPIVTSARIIDQIQSIVSREISPFSNAVITVGKIAGGTAFNVIPDTVHFEGTLRTFDENERLFMKQRLITFIEDIARLHRCRAEIQYVDGYPPVINHKANACLVRECAASVIPENNIHHDIKTLAGEDFAYFMHEVPGAFMLLGTGQKESFPHHHPKFNFDEAMLEKGAEIFLAIAQKHWEP